MFNGPNENFSLDPGPPTKQGLVPVFSLELTSIGQAAGLAGLHSLQVSAKPGQKAILHSSGQCHQSVHPNLSTPACLQGPLYKSHVDAM